MFLDGYGIGNAVTLLNRAFLPQCNGIVIVSCIVDSRTTVIVVLVVVAMKMPML